MVVASVEVIASHNVVVQLVVGVEVSVLVALLVIELVSLVVGVLVALLVSVVMGLLVALLVGVTLLLTLEKKDDIETLKDVEFSAFSQFGEDGIIDWIINKIPNIEKIFLEIGTQDYSESNTRYIFETMRCEGLIIDPTPNLEKKIIREKKKSHLSSLNQIDKIKKTLKN